MLVPLLRLRVTGVQRFEYSFRHRQFSARGVLIVTSPHVGVTLAATEHNRLCRGQVDGMETQSQELLIAGITLAKKTYEGAKREFGWSPDAVAEYVLHQVSRPYTDKLARALELPSDKFLAAHAELGNVGPAGVPMVLSKALEAGRIQAGDRVALMGIGSGLNCTMAEVVW